MTKDKAIAEFRKLNIQDLRLLVEHGQKKQYIRSKTIEQFISNVWDEAERVGYAEGWEQQLKFRVQDNLTQSEEGK